MIRATFFSLIVFMLFFQGSCNDENFEGRILTEKTEILVNEDLFLEALPDNGHDKIYMARWDVYPVEGNYEMEYPLIQGADTFKFKSRFKAFEPGEYEIAVTFLYKNTAPRPADSVNILVRDSL